MVSAQAAPPAWRATPTACTKSIRQTSKRFDTPLPFAPVVLATLPSRIYLSPLSSDSLSLTPYGREWTEDETKPALMKYHRLESSHPSVVAERLSRIEALLEEQAQRLDDIARQANAPLRTSSTGGFAPSPFSEANTFALLSQNVSPQMVAASASVPNRLTLPEPLDARLDQAHFLIPRDHSTSANSLLDHAKIRSLLGEYPADYFYNIEETLPLPPALDTLRGGADDDWPSFPDEAVLESLADRYFVHVHPHFPIFTRQSFLKSQALFFEYGPQQTPETAICLCVYALGCLVSPDEPTAGARLQHECDSLALQFFQPCLRIIVQKSFWDFRPSIVMCQALVLCSAYFSLMGRPLHSWKMVYSASSKYMSILDQ